MATENSNPLKKLEQLGDLVAYLMLQRQNNKPIIFLRQIVRDIKQLLCKLISSHYLFLSPEESASFLEDVTSLLDELGLAASEERLDEYFCDYCVEKIISSFEYADRLKISDITLDKKMSLISRIRLVEDFDFQLRPLLRLVSQSAQKKSI